MTISLETCEGGAVFEYPAGYDDVVEALNDALDDRDAGRISLESCVATLQRLVKRHPDFIDGHAHLGNALLDQGKPKAALNACLRGVAIGEKIIPADFQGAIEWGHLDNRPFLRAAHGAALCHLRLGQRKKALGLMEKLLKWNPGDHQGVRYLIGSEYFRDGRVAEARAFFEAEAGYYPPYRYELALLLWREGDRPAAATSLRHGFVENGYIAEMLCGNPEPAPLAIWHGSNFAAPELARDYVSDYADLWRLTPAAIAFLRWLHMHPKILTERAAVLECQQELLWEHDVERRRRLLDREAEARQRIDDSLSAQIVRDRPDRHGRLVSPWLYPSTR